MRVSEFECNACSRSLVNVCVSGVKLYLSDIDVNAQLDTSQLYKEALLPTGRDH